MTTSTKNRVAEVLNHKPDASVEYVGRMLSICGDRPRRSAIVAALVALRGRA